MVVTCMKTNGIQANLCGVYLHKGKKIYWNKINRTFVG